MVAVQVMGNDTAITVAASQGNFQLNVFLPVSAYNFLLSANLLAAWNLFSSGTNSTPVRAVSFSQTALSKPLGELRPVPTAVPPIASERLSIPTTR